MFWVGLFTGIIVYVVFTLVMVIITKAKIKKNKQKQNDYNTIVNSEIEKNKRG